MQKKTLHSKWRIFVIYCVNVSIECLFATLPIFGYIHPHISGPYILIFLVSTDKHLQTAFWGMHAYIWTYLVVRSDWAYFFIFLPPSSCLCTVISHHHNHHQGVQFFGSFFFTKNLIIFRWNDFKYFSDFWWYLTREWNTEHSTVSVLHGDNNHCLTSPHPLPGHLFSSFVALIKSIRTWRQAN